MSRARGEVRWQRDESGVGGLRGGSLTPTGGEGRPRLHRGARGGGRAQVRGRIGRSGRSGRGGVSVSVSIYMYVCESIYTCTHTHVYSIPGPLAIITDIKDFDKVLTTGQLIASL